MNKISKLAQNIDDKIHYLELNVEELNKNVVDINSQMSMLKTYITNIHQTLNLLIENVNQSKELRNKGKLKIQNDNDTSSSESDDDSNNNVHPTTSKQKQLNKNNKLDKEKNVSKNNNSRRALRRLLI